MSKWKCDICNLKFENFEARGFEGVIYCPLCYYKKLYKDTELERERLNNDYLEMKDNFRVANDEIERLKQDNENLNRVNIELSTLNTSLRSDRDNYKYIIKEVREYITTLAITKYGEIDIDKVLDKLIYMLDKGE